MVKAETRDMPMNVEIVNYRTEFADALVEVINRAFAPLRELPRVNPEGPELGIYTHADLARHLSEGLLDPVFSHVALADGRPIALVECRLNAVRDIAEIGWIAAHPEFTGHALARRCLERALRAALDHGATDARTWHTIDSRWTDACAFLTAMGFEVQNPQKHNITMQIDLDAYEPREPVVPEGYEIVTYKDGDSAEWAALKDAIFGGETAPDQFLREFAARHDFDPAGWFFVVHEGRKVGMTGAMICRNRQTGVVTGGQIHWVGALAEERGKGLGEALMLAGLNYFKALEADPCVLVTQHFRVPAVTLYEKLGFRLVREEQIYIRKL